MAAWGVLLLGAQGLPGFTGGTGPVLAAVHLLTLGVLALTAMGASYQLLPVVTRQPLARTWPASLSFWLTAPGIVALTWGMFTARPMALTGGAWLASGSNATFESLGKRSIFTQETQMS